MPLQLKMQMLVPALPGYSIGYSLSTYVAMCQAQGQVFLTILEYKYFGIFQAQIQVLQVEIKR